MDNLYPSELESKFVDFVSNGIGGIVAAMGLTFIAFEGYEIIVQSGEEVKNPKKNIPLLKTSNIFLKVSMHKLQ